ncbi:MAG: hypothetical protein GEU96_14245 [Propionibacteriales bacterium]|nr:hypothetical protein [Propionibacteriales bacterium]
MPDPFDDLRRLSEAGAREATMVASTEVHRRGDRRRRQQLAGWTCSALLVAGVSTAGILTSDVMNLSDPAPAPPATNNASPPPDGWHLRIPADFPLGSGLPEAGGDIPAWEESEEVDEPIKNLPCDEQGLDVADPPREDALGVTVSPPASSAWRQLLVYPDSAAAAATLQEIRGQAEACDPEVAQPDLSEFRWTVRDLPYGGHDVMEVYGQEYALDGGNAGIGRTVIAVVRVGNALLVAGSSDEGGSDQEVAEPEFVRDVADVADAMCIFASNPCES